MLKKTIYMAAIAATLVGAPYAYSQTMSARGVQGVDSASGQSLALAIDELNRTVTNLVTQVGNVNTRLDGIDARLDGIDTRLDGIDTRLDGLDTSVTNLTTRVTTLEATTQNINTRLTNIENNPGILLDQLQLVVASNSSCVRRENGYTSLTVSCPAGHKLISCTGGAGDLFEDNEGYFIRPVLAQNKCEIMIKEPACKYPGTQQLRTQLFAICMKTS